LKTKENIPEKKQREQVVPQLQKSRAAMVEPLLYLCFALVAFFLYSNTFQSPYMFDDWAHIQANRHIQITSLSWDSILEAGFDSPLKRRPVAYITLAFNYYFHGFDLAGYHFVNILIHLAAGIFLYMFLHTTLSLQQAGQKSGHAGWLPFTVAMIWLVHPLQTQSVTYIIQRMNSLAAMFFILAMLLYVRGRLAKGKGKQSILFVGSICSGVLALGSKENAATLPFFILLYEWFFFQDLNFAWLRKRFLPIVGVGIFLVSVAILFLGQHPIDAIQNSYGIRDFDMGQRVLTEFRVVIFYISLLLFPHPARLNIEHDFQLSLSPLDPFSTILSLAVLLGLFCLAIMVSKRERIIAFSILWFLGNLVIESSVIGIEIIFEHRVYLPSMLAVLAIVLVCNRLLTKRWLQVLMAIIVVSLFSTWTYQRNLVWQDEVTLRRDAVSKSPDKPRAFAILANALERNHEYDEAEFYYNETLSLNPKNADEIHFNLGNVLVAKGKLDDAVQHFSKAISLNPNVASMRLNLAYALTLQGRGSEAFIELQELLRRHPKEPRAHNNLGVLFMNQRKFKEAALHFNEAVKLQPNYKQARKNLDIARRSLQKEASGQ
jgi:tetratricopeptide (TPR) repeat protein